MIWTLLSVAMCAALAVRLMFYSDAHRQDSRWYWRVVLFLVTIYAGLHVIDFLYHPDNEVHPWVALFHMALLFGAFLMKPQYLPWNGYHDPAVQAHRAVLDATSRLRYRLRGASVHGRQGPAAQRK